MAPKVLSTLTAESVMNMMIDCMQLIFLAFETCQISEGFSFDFQLL
jgi:hypothetical protein